ncbi:SDR family NAD(P)-dependent oxidoreductase [Rhodococcus oxybenzonivorans]|uniref:SDR family NAD(P)-dependent oxidoreductase n=1 Tax=Rhodococcus oxybenzonivorans TaxID=1990687 RepID=UPI00202BA1CC|nr:SDR family oxidoreductase [Rhodococcus oxybenzonivorans]
MLRIYGRVITLTRATAVEYGAKGIRANSICPGAIETPLSQSGKNGDIELATQVQPKDPTEAGNQTIALTPISRWGRPDEIASLAVYLAADESQYTTGQAISVDGGYTSM